MSDQPGRFNDAPRLRAEVAYLQKSLTEKANEIERLKADKKALIEASYERRDQANKDADEIDRLRERIADYETQLHSEVDSAKEIERLRALIDQLRSKQEREYDPNVAPADDAEFGTKP